MAVLSPLGLLFLSLVVARAQDRYYQFAADQDRLSGAVDFSHLNHPLGPEDRLIIHDGHFYTIGPDRLPNTADDRRLRLFGVNLSFGGNFPAETDAVRIARRLRRLGVNLVRLHHLDSSPDSDPDNARSILTTGPYPTFNPVAVRRLRAFLDALRAEGIYVNLNLHVGYQFRPAVDQVPPLESFPTQSKPLHIFYPRMVELQMDYAQKLIQLLGVERDPVLAMVEINNESSLLQAWQQNRLDRYLAGEYRTTLQRRWNRFLVGRHRSTEQLRLAWGLTTPDGPEVLTMGWQLEKGAPSDGYFQESAVEPGLIKVVVTSDGPRLNFKKVGFTIQQGSRYVAEIDVMAEIPDGVWRSAYFNVKQDVSPWRVMSGKSISISNRWQTFRMSFYAPFAMDGVGRFALDLASVPAGTTLWVRNPSLRLAGATGLSPGESLEQGNVPLVGEDDASTAGRASDYLAFLAASDRAYLWAMLSSVRRLCGRLVPVAGTQVRWGGLLNLDSHADLDYADNHFYVDHPNFPNRAWDPWDWRIRDSSNIASGLEALLGIAAARQAGKPYTVSEFNQPWPNRQGAEIDPTVAVFAAFQDWDALMHFAYAHDNDWDENVPEGFDLDGDWAKIVNFGQAAWLFRSGVISPARETVSIPVSFEHRLQAGREKRNADIAGFLNSVLGYEPTVALRHRVELAKDSTAPLAESARQPPEWPVVADTGEFAYHAGGRVLVIQSPMAAGVFGYTGESRITAGPLEVELAPASRGFAAVLLTPVDGRPLVESRRLLLSNSGAVLRTQPGSNPPRPQYLVPRPEDSTWWTIEPEPSNPAKPSGNRSSGVGPTWMERVEAYVTVRLLANALTVYPLDGSGVRMPPLAPEEVLRIEGGFRIHLQAPGRQASPWYEVLVQ